MLLGEQQELPFVERFAQTQANSQFQRLGFYRELIPDRQPNPGEQLAFQVNLDACTGCKACVSACHSLNGLDEDETWRDVGLLIGHDSEAPYQQHITTACHHCADPACLNGCPVLAYEKDPITGIVRHLDDQCIGCQYCVLKCPYDVPKYSKKRGIVRKCDMCFNRLARDEAPACVQACPSGAIAIQIVSLNTVIAETAQNERLVPGSFKSSYTRPTSAYVSRKPIPENVRASDQSSLRLEHPHWPLIVMLVLTQMAAGLVVTAAALSFSDLIGFNMILGPASVAISTLLAAGLAASILHLGRPLGAWRAWLGIRTSWMSREIVAFGGFFGLALALTIAAWLLPRSALFDPSVQPNLLVQGTRMTAVVGILSIACSAMIYIDTQRPFWAWRQVLPKFFGSVIVTGLIGGAFLTVSHKELVVLSTRLLTAGLVAFLLLALWELVGSLYALRRKQHTLNTANKIIWFRLSHLACLRITSAVLVIALGLLINRLPAGFQFWLTLAVGLLSLGWILGERYIFFVSSVAPRMPGGVTP
jgi:Fe-S-cluster-containing dehydrogenase component/DMSO reductase anchor subunit